MLFGFLSEGILAIAIWSAFVYFYAIWVAKQL